MHLGIVDFIQILDDYKLRFTHFVGAGFQPWLSVSENPRCVIGATASSGLTATKTEPKGWRPRTQEEERMIRAPLRRPAPAREVRLRDLPLPSRSKYPYAMLGQCSALTRSLRRQGTLGVHQGAPLRREALGANLRGRE